VDQSTGRRIGDSLFLTRTNDPLKHVIHNATRGRLVEKLNGEV